MEQKDFERIKLADGVRFTRKGKEFIGTVVGVKEKSLRVSCDHAASDYTYVFTVHLEDIVEHIPITKWLDYTVKDEHLFV